MFVKPPGPRHTSIEVADGLEIGIPTKRNIFLFGFLSLWLCGWLMGEIMAPIGFFAAAKKGPGSGLFLLFWLCGWTLGGAVAIFIWLWQLKGREVITVSARAISIRREIAGYGYSRHYEVAEIRRLRVAPLSFNPFDFGSSMALWGIGGGALAFDYGFKTYRFGAGIDEAEAYIILQAIADRLPHLSDATDE